MIVLDEQLNDPQIVAAIRQWYKGKVITINELRFHSVIKDDNIPTLLHQQKSATFVTINYDDFYRKIEPHANYCVICFGWTAKIWTRSLIYFANYCAATSSIQSASARA